VFLRRLDVGTLPGLVRGRGAGERGQAEAGPLRGAGQPACRELRRDLRVGDGRGERRGDLFPEAGRRVGHAGGVQRLAGQRVDQRPARR